MDHLSVMKKVPLLYGIPEETKAAHLKDGGFLFREYGRGRIIHLEGEPCTKLEVILSGSAVVERIDAAGSLMTIGEFFAGDILGGNLLFSKSPYFPMTITAKQVSVILEIEKECLLQLCCESKTFLQAYLEQLSEHALILGNRIRYYVNKSIRECIVSYLKYERDRQNSNRIRLSMTKKALAERMGVQRTSLSRELTKMKQEGLLAYDGDTITVLNPSILK